LRRERAELADGIGQTIVAERKQSRAVIDALTARVAAAEERAAVVEEITKRREFYESLAARVTAIEQRAAPDNEAGGLVFDLSDERRRRAGE
jgi:hypothetical protein